jgi:hypothetical protein
MTRPAKWLRLLGFARGSLSRRSDWAQRMLFAGAVLATLLVIPVAADAAGSVPPERATDRSQTVVTFTEDAYAPVFSSEYATTQGIKVKASWQAPGGAARSGEVEVSTDVKAGDKITIWTDPVGNVVDGPTASTRHVVDMFLTAAAAVAGWLGGVVLCYLIISWLLFHRRVMSWDAEWERADREWRQTA